MVLLLGLGIHKLVWETLARKRDKTRSAADERPRTRLIKLLKVAMLAGIVGQTLFLPDFPPISNAPEPLRAIGLLIYGAGLVTAIIGRVQLGDNWANLEEFQVLPNQSLVTTGIYRHIRHPIYTGDVLLLLGLELTLNSWLVLGILPVLIFVRRQARAEEAMLTATFPGYEAYRQRTRMFIPLVW